MGLKDSKAVFLQLQIKGKEVEGKWKSNKLSIQALTFWFFIAASCISDTCNMSLMLSRKEKG